MPMIGCLISLLIAAIVALIVLLIVELVFTQFVPLSARTIAIIRAIIGLVLLAYFLECFLGGSGFPTYYPGHWHG